MAEYSLYKFYVEPKEREEDYVRMSLGLNLNSLRTIELCMISFIGGIVQGFINFGFSEINPFFLKIHLLADRLLLIGPQSVFHVPILVAFFAVFVVVF